METRFEVELPEEIATAVEIYGPVFEMPEVWRKQEGKFLPEWAEANELIARIKTEPRKLSWLVKWFTELGCEDVPFRTHKRVALDNFFHRRGFREQAVNWRSRQNKHLRKLHDAKMKRPLSIKASREIVWRVASQLQHRLCDDFTREIVAQGDDAPVALVSKGYEFLPPEMRWVISHPGLSYTVEGIVANQVVADRVRAYQEKFPCPDEPTSNFFHSIRGNQKEVAALMKDVGKRRLEYLDAEKKAKEERKRAAAEIKLAEETKPVQGTDVVDVREFIQGEKNA